MGSRCSAHALPLQDRGPAGRKNSAEELPSTPRAISSRPPARQAQEQTPKNYHPPRAIQRARHPTKTADQAATGTNIEELPLSARTTSPRPRTSPAQAQAVEELPPTLHTTSPRPPARQTQEQTPKNYRPPCAKQRARHLSKTASQAATGTNIEELPLSARTTPPRPRTSPAQTQAVEELPPTLHTTSPRPPATQAQEQTPKNYRPPCAIQRARHLTKTASQAATATNIEELPLSARTTPPRPQASRTQAQAVEELPPTLHTTSPRPPARQTQEQTPKNCRPLRAPSHQDRRPRRGKDKR